MRTISTVRQVLLRDKEEAPSRKDIAIQTPAASQNLRISALQKVEDMYADREPNATEEHNEVKHSETRQEHLAEKTTAK